MQDMKFNAEVNPFGVLYHPSAILKALDNVAQRRKLDSQDLVKTGHGVFHWDYHGQFFGENEEGLKCKVEALYDSLTSLLPSTDYFFVSLGSAFFYRLKNQNRSVGNCHQWPNKDFEKHLSTVDQITVILDEMESVILRFNPNAKIICTISPVRYLKDGLIQNQRSKAILTEAVHQWSDRSVNVSYFPSYELLLDDLRDYRFYSDDMLHPSPQAVHYIWEYFKDSFFDQQTMATIADIEKINKSINHRPLHPTSIDHQAFLRNLKRQVEQFQIKFPYIDFKEEMADIKRRLEGD